MVQADDSQAGSSSSAGRRGAGPTGSGRASGGRGTAPTRSSAPRSGAPAGRGRPTREELDKRTYDPRREERRRATRVALPEDVDARELDGEARRELRSLSKETADLVARHLVMTGRLLDEDPEQALAHARAARALAGRIGVVREAAGLAAYSAGEWSEAISELRASRRITGRPDHLGVLADCERALGRPERALTYGDDPQLSQVSQDQRVELVMVLAGARRDMDQPDAAVLALQDPARRTSASRPWAARLWYAYADALLGAGRSEDAREWFAKAAAADAEGQTDAGDRVLELDGVVLEDPDDLDDALPTALPTEAELAELVRGIAPLERPSSVPSRPDPEPTAAPAPEPLPTSGVALPTFVAPSEPEQAAAAQEPGDDDLDEGGELRLFD